MGLFYTTVGGGADPGLSPRAARSEKHKYRLATPCEDAICHYSSHRRAERSGWRGAARRGVFLSLTPNDHLRPAIRCTRFLSPAPLQTAIHPPALPALLALCRGSAARGPGWRGEWRVVRCVFAVVLTSQVPLRLLSRGSS